MAVLGSGSLGNSTIIESDNTTLLIDAGLSAKQLRLRMENLGVSADDLEGVLLTHEHSDHAKGLKVLLKSSNTPIYANPLTSETLSKSMPGMNWKLFQNNQSFQVGDFTVQPFPVPHDAQDPVGYVLSANGIRIGVITDAGYATNTVKSALEDLDILFIEANYDEKLLEADVKRPWSIKQRICSRHGHLSNEQAAELYCEIATQKLKTILIGHLSSDCNTPECVEKAFKQRCADSDTPMPDVIEYATQGFVTKWHTVDYVDDSSAIIYDKAIQEELFSL